MIHYISEIKKLEPEEVLLMYYDKKKKDDIQEIIIERQLQNVKRIYHATDKPVTIGQTNATKCIPLYNEYYFIRLWVKKKDPKEINVRLGRDNKKQLLEWLNDPKKKRYLSKTSESALEKYLNHIYHFDNQSKISSVKEY
jgi:hypothetical protein